MENEEERAKIMELQQTNKALKEQLQLYAECDPDALEKLKEESEVC